MANMSVSLLMRTVKVQSDFDISRNDIVTLFKHVGQVSSVYHCGFGEYFVIFESGVSLATALNLTGKWIGLTRVEVTEVKQVEDLKRLDECTRWGDNYQTVNMEVSHGSDPGIGGGLFTSTPDVSGGEPKTVLPSEIGVSSILEQLGKLPEVMRQQIRESLGGVKEVKPSTSKNVHFQEDVNQDWVGAGSGNETNPFLVPMEGAAIPARDPTTVQQAFPQARLNTFSGTNAKGEVSYAIWRSEVRGYVRENLIPQTQVLQAMRRSLRGAAADVLLTLGDEVTVEGALGKLDSIFGDVWPADVLLEQFYTARQAEAENVATWACRLEKIASQARKVTYLDIGMLRSKFWSGLRSVDLRNALRHKYDSGVAFEDLVGCGRVAEIECNDVRGNRGSSASVPSSSHQVAQVNTLPQNIGEYVRSQVSENLNILGGKLDNVLQKLEHTNKKDARPGVAQAPRQFMPPIPPPPFLFQPNVPPPPVPGAVMGERGWEFYPQTGSNSFNNTREFQGQCFRCGAYGHRRFECTQGN